MGSGGRSTAPYCGGKDTAAPFRIDFAASTGFAMGGTLTTTNPVDLQRFSVD
jgi:hypothetical protein